MAQDENIDLQLGIQSTRNDKYESLCLFSLKIFKTTRVLFKAKIITVVGLFHV